MYSIETFKYIKHLPVKNGQEKAKGNIHNPHHQKDNTKQAGKAKAERTKANRQAEASHSSY